MKDPERLTTMRTTGSIHLLLEAARDEAPPAGARERTLAVLAARAGGLPSARKATGKLAVMAKGVVWVSAILSVTAAVWWTSTRRLDAPRAAAAPATRTDSEEVSPLPATASLDTAATSPRAAKPVGEAPAIAARPPVTTGVRPSPSRLAQEVAAIDSARGALSSGDPKQCLERLDGYARSFPRGAFLPEAVFLRVDALLQTGDRATAEKLARDFGAANPSSPYAAEMDRRIDARSR